MKLYLPILTALTVLISYQSYADSNQFRISESSATGVLIAAGAKVSTPTESAGQKEDGNTEPEDESTVTQSFNYGDGYAEFADPSNGAAGYGCQFATLDQLPTGISLDKIPESSGKCSIYLSKPMPLSQGSDYDIQFSLSESETYGSSSRTEMYIRSGGNNVFKAAKFGDTDGSSTYAPAAGLSINLPFNKGELYKLSKRGNVYSAAINGNIVAQHESGEAFYDDYVFHVRTSNNKIILDNFSFTVYSENN